MGLRSKGEVVSADRMWKTKSRDTKVAMREGMVRLSPPKSASARSRRLALPGEAEESVA